MTDERPGGGDEGWVSRVRRFLRPVRHFPDRVLHPVRRRRALRSLETARTPYSVLFLCEGNICRSPYAAGAFARLLPEPLRQDIRILSAGFLAPGHAPPPEALTVAAARGVDLSKHRSSDRFEAADLVVVMDVKQRDAARSRLGARTPVLLLGDLDPVWGGTRHVLDPVFRPREYFEAVYERIDRCLEVLVEAISG